MLSFIDKVTTATYSLAIVIWNVAPAASDAAAAWTGGLAFGSAATAAVLDIWDIIQSSDPDKSSYSSQLIKGKSRDLKIIQIWTTASVFHLLLLAGVLSIIFVLCSKVLLAVALLLITL